MDNPFLKLRYLSYYLSGWVIIASIHFLILYVSLNLGWAYALSDSLIFNGSFMLLGVSLWYSVRYIRIENNPLPLVMLKNIIGGGITALAAVGLGNFIFYHIIQPGNHTIEFLNKTFYWRLLIGCLYYEVVVAVIYLYIFYEKLTLKAAKESELNSLIKEAELKTLKYQLNPHFIFNSLNSISSLTITDPDKAREMIIKLSAFLRSTLSENERQTNELGEEIKNIKLYLDIEKIRFGDKFELREELSYECLKIKIPNMIFQPLFENAIKYGVYESLEKVIIKVKCTRENNYLKFTVENNFDEDGHIKKGKGIGLQNIKNRLSLIYNQDNLFAVEKKKGLFTVSIFIPLDQRL
jgi:two-component system LytT family sensor kinase